MKCLAVMEALLPGALHFLNKQISIYDLIDSNRKRHAPRIQKSEKRLTTSFSLPSTNNSQKSEDISFRLLCTLRGPV